MSIAYVKHPVAKEDVERLGKEGFKIVDIKFKPKEINSGDKVVDGKPTGKSTAKAKK